MKKFDIRLDRSLRHLGKNIRPWKLTCPCGMKLGSYTFDEAVEQMLTICNDPACHEASELVEWLRPNHPGEIRLKAEGTVNLETLTLLTGVESIDARTIVVPINADGSFSAEIPVLDAKFCTGTPPHEGHNWSEWNTRTRQRTDYYCTGEPDTPSEEASLLSWINAQIESSSYDIESYVQQPGPLDMSASIAVLVLGARQQVLTEVRDRIKGPGAREGED